MAHSSTSLLIKHARPPAPCLSPDHLRLAQSTPQSTVTSLSSQFLSPPISNPPTCSPPPRIEAEDYVSARGKRAKGKHHSLTGQRLAPKVLHSDDMLSSRLHPSASSSPVPSDRALSDRFPIGSVALGETRSDLIGRQSSFSLAGGLHSYVQNPTVSRVNTLVKAETETRSDSNAYSPATESLRRLSCSWQVNERSTLRRLSDNLGSTLSKARQQLPHSLATTSTHDLNRDRSIAEVGSARDKDPTGTRLVSRTSRPSSPASIILRKPSEAPYFAQNSSTIESRSECGDDCRNIDSRTPFSELISFRTTILSPLADVVSANDFKNSRTRSSTLTFSSSSGKGTPKAFISVEEASSKHSSPVANTALTFADTHVAPGTFALDLDSQVASMQSDSPPRRLSLVQITSKDSIHEVIWSEGDSRSDSGSSPSRDTTLQYEQHFLDGPRLKSTQKQASPRNLINGRGDTAQATTFRARRVKTLSSLDQTLLQWVWQERPRLTLHDQTTESQEAPDAVSSDQAGSTSGADDVVVSYQPAARKQTP